eukprot:TRINITY_DN30267_c0_g1_i1.p1 TRINITY_DN30267_c0_g1~~TRINITY_DN30267_c0_g1_i1.p1  ORF type:complete len:174 (-),score=26.63 TRINITY_DN30267_c0_g1_i1:5-526(-)
MKAPRKHSTTRGFARADRLLKGQIRSATEAKGFAETRLLTRWSEVAGADMAAISRPVEVSYGRGGMGATLTLLTTGAQAPMLEMQLPRLLDKVNACYGYRAIARIRLTQTAPTGFSEGQADFSPAPKTVKPEPDPAAKGRAAETAQDISDDRLRAALSALGANVISRQKGKTS